MRSLFSAIMSLAVPDSLRTKRSPRTCGQTGWASQGTEGWAGRVGWWLDVAVGCGGGWGEAERQTDRSLGGLSVGWWGGAHQVLGEDAHRGDN